MREKHTAPVMIAPWKIEYRDYELPEIGPRDTLVKMKLCGVCGSDLHLYHGESNAPTRAFKDTSCLAKWSRLEQKQP